MTTFVESHWYWYAWGTCSDVKQTNQWVKHTLNMTDWVNFVSVSEVTSFILQNAIVMADSLDWNIKVRRVCKQPIHSLKSLSSDFISQCNNVSCVTLPRVSKVDKTGRHHHRAWKHNNTYNTRIHQPSNVCRSFSVTTSNMYMMPSMAPQAMYLPSGLCTWSSQHTLHARHVYNEQWTQLNHSVPVVHVTRLQRAVNTAESSSASGACHMLQRAVNTAESSFSASGACNMLQRAVNTAESSSASGACNMFTTSSEHSRIIQCQWCM